MWKYKVIPQYLKGSELNLSLSRLSNLRWSTTVAAEKVDSHFGETALSTAKPFKKMPSMTMIPFIGTAWAYMPIIGPYELQKLHLALRDKHKKFGDAFREKFGPLNVVITCSPDDFQMVIENEGDYPSRGEFATMKVYRESRKQWYKSIGVMLLEGKEWWDLRSKTQKHLMKPKAIHSFLNPMQDVARDLVYKICKVKDAKHEVPDLLGDLYKWSLESVALVGLDTRLGSLQVDLPPDSVGLKVINSVHTQMECMNKLEGFVGNLPWWKLFRTPTWKKMEAAADVFGEFAFTHINRAFEQLKKTENEDKDLTLLQSMLLSKELDVSSIMVMVSDMLMAGIDTTSNTVAYFLYHMAQNPDKQELLYQEIRKLLPSKEDRITTEIFNELRYLKACFKESQRLLPVAIGTARTLDHDVIVSGYRVPAGTMILINAQETYLKEKFFKNANQYLPERWFEKGDKFHRFAFRPFSVGIRSCIGRRLAELEMISVATEIIRNFKLEYHYEEIGTYTRMAVVPDRPLKLTFIER